MKMVKRQSVDANGNGVPGMFRMEEMPDSIPLSILPCIRFGERLQDKNGPRLAECAGVLGRPNHQPLHACSHPANSTGQCTQEGKADNAWSCYACNYKRTAAGMFINHGAGGLGDALLGLTAICGAKQEYPETPIIYRVHPNAVAFVQLFTGPDYLGRHTHDANKDNAPDADIQINLGYSREMLTKGKLPRWERYRNNIGVKTSILPVLREPERLRALGADYAGAIVLAPFSTWSNREYPVHSWMTLEKLLTAAGYRCVVLDRADSRFPDRHKQMTSECVLDAPAERVTGIILNAACLIGGDSGLTHLSGIVGKPTIALCGQTRGDKIFGLYPHVISLQGCLACDACYWQEPYAGSKCDSCCPSLASITPQRIADEVNRLCLPPIAGLKAVVNHQKLARIRHELIYRRDLAGDIAEAGVYLGGVAKFIERFAFANTGHGVLFLDDRLSRWEFLRKRLPFATWAQTLEQFTSALDQTWQAILLDHDLCEEVDCDAAKINGVEACKLLAARDVRSRLIVHTTNAAAAPKMLNELSLGRLTAERASFDSPEFAAIIRSITTMPLLHLFDTFAGAPYDDVHGLHCKGDFADTSLEAVRNFVANPRAVYHVGTFPETAVDALRFKFVHVDLDSYQGTQAAIEYFAPRMVAGGVMLFDDFGWYKCPGVAKALHESTLKFEESVPGQAIVRF